MNFFLIRTTACGAAPPFLRINSEKVGTAAGVGCLPAYMAARLWRPAGPGISSSEVVNLAESSIDLVRKAEDGAEATARAALREAARIVEEANARAAKLASDEAAAAREKAAQEVAAARAASQKALEAAGQSLLGELEALAETARAAQPAAIEKILAALQEQVPTNTDSTR